MKVCPSPAHTSTVTCCRLSGDGCGSCSCSMDRTALVWELRAHKRLLTLRYPPPPPPQSDSHSPPVCSGHANVVSACAYSSNSHAVVTACWDKLLRVFDVSSGGYRSAGPALLQQHHGCISSCCFSSDGWPHPLIPAVTYSCLLRRFPAGFSWL